MISFIKNLFSKEDKQNNNHLKIKNKKWPINIIKVYIAPIKFSNYTGQETLYRNMVIQAFNTWALASGERLKFETTNLLLDSNINIVWKKLDGQNFGSCHISWDNQGRLFGAEIYIDLKTKRIDGIDYETEIYHSILHCVGISLGIPQSNNPDDIMCIPHQYGKIELSENDKNAIYDLYNSTIENYNENDEK